MEKLALLSPMLAYFDPGSGSLILQAIVGGTAGLLVFGKYVWNLVILRYSRLKSKSDSGHCRAGMR